MPTKENYSLIERPQNYNRAIIETDIIHLL